MAKEGRHYIPRFVRQISRLCHKVVLVMNGILAGQNSALRPKKTILGTYPFEFQ